MSIGILNQYNIKDINERIVTVEDFLMSSEKWFEKAAVPVGETHIADEIGQGIGAFQIDAGNDDWGLWLLIMGSSDTPLTPGRKYFSLRGMDMASAERDETYFIQVAAGEDPDVVIAEKEYYADFSITPLSNQIDSGVLYLQSKRCSVNTKIWIRCKCPGFDTGTLDFYFGLIEFVT